MNKVKIILLIALFIFLFGCETTIHGYVTFEKTDKGWKAKEITVPFLGRENPITKQSVEEYEKLLDEKLGK
ncbi:MAG: hypothetical protein HUU50_23215 [Candidatus Brocadiae bacterium]|nr:hypothetical protein [Candidatus Brocadiia bacterium]